MLTAGIKQKKYQAGTGEGSSSSPVVSLTHEQIYSLQLSCANLQNGADYSNEKPHGKHSVNTNILMTHKVTEKKHFQRGFQIGTARLQGSHLEGRSAKRPSSLLSIHMSRAEPLGSAPGWLWPTHSSMAHGLPFAPGAGRARAVGQWTGETQVLTSWSSQPRQTDRR